VTTDALEERSGQATDHAFLTAHIGFASRRRPCRDVPARLDQDDGGALLFRGDGGHDATGGAAVTTTSACCGDWA
jgi:hypothetical protein